MFTQNLTMAQRIFCRSLHNFSAFSISLGMWTSSYIFQFLLVCDLVRVQAPSSQHPGHACEDALSEFRGQDLQELAVDELLADDLSTELHLAPGDNTEVILDQELPAQTSQGDLDDSEALAIGVGETMEGGPGSLDVFKFLSPDLLLAVLCQFSLIIVFPCRSRYKQS